MWNCEIPKWFPRTFRLPDPCFSIRWDVLSEYLAKSWSREIGNLSYHMALKFDKHVGRTAAKVHVKFGSDRTILSTNLAALSLWDLRIRRLIGYWNAAPFYTQWFRVIYIEEFLFQTNRVIYIEEFLFQTNRLQKCTFTDGKLIASSSHFEIMLLNPPMRL